MTAPPGAAARAEALRRLHRPGDPLILANAWDVASARVVAGAGFPAVATTSAGVAQALGYADGENMPVDVAFAAVARIAAAVPVPVTADLEAGYGLDPDALAERLLEAGAVGLNLEDSAGEGHRFVDASAQAERIAALKAAARRRGVDIVVNARTDGFLAQREGGPAVLEEAVRRGRLYLEAGADCVYPIGVRAESDIAALVAGLGTINVLALPGLHPKQLAGLGVARVSYGSGFFRQAMAWLRERLAELD